jgi:uncharacterized membrane protein YkoI
MRASCVALVVAAMLGGVAGAAVADEVKLEQVTPAARATIEKETAGGRIKEIERERKNGRVVYEVEFVQGDREREIHVAEDGTVVKREKD